MTTSRSWPWPGPLAPEPLRASAHSSRGGALRRGSAPRSGGQRRAISGTANHKRGEPAHGEGSDQRHRRPRGDEADHEHDGDGQCQGDRGESHDGDSVGGTHEATTLGAVGRPTGGRRRVRRAMRSTGPPARGWRRRAARWPWVSLTKRTVKGSERSRRGPALRSRQPASPGGARRGSGRAAPMQPRCARRPPGRMAGPIYARIRRAGSSRPAGAPRAGGW